MRFFISMMVTIEITLMPVALPAASDVSELVVNKCDDKRGCLKWVVISDTHSLEKKKDARNILQNLPEGDVLLHAGDFTDTGKVSEIKNFIDFLEEARRTKGYSKVIFIAGNHDITVDMTFYQGLESWDKHNFGHWEEQNIELVQKMLKNLPEGIYYLQDQAMVVNGFTIYGSPWSPSFGNWAFNGSPEELSEKWSKIPGQTDILMTHGPAYGYGDQVMVTERRGYGSRRVIKNIGCPMLLERIHEIKPFIHLSGHVHEGYGVFHELGLNTYFVNASTATHRYDPYNPAVVFYTPLKKAAVREEPASEVKQQEDEAL